MSRRREDALQRRKALRSSATERLGDVPEAGPATLVRKLIEGFAGASDATSVATVEVAAAGYVSETGEVTATWADDTTEAAVVPDEGAEGGETAGATGAAAAGATVALAWAMGAAATGAIVALAWATGAAATGETVALGAAAALAEFGGAATIAPDASCVATVEATAAAGAAAGAAVTLGAAPDGEAAGASPKVSVPAALMVCPSEMSSSDGNRV